MSAALNEALRITEEAAVTVTSEVLPGYSPRGGRRKTRLPGVPAQKTPRNFEQSEFPIDTVIGNLNFLNFGMIVIIVF